MSITDERKKQVDFTDHYYSGGLRYVGAAGTNLDSLKGKVIGAQRSTVASQYLEDKLSGVATIKLYDTQDNVYLTSSPAASMVPYRTNCRPTTGSPPMLARASSSRGTPSPRMTKSVLPCARVTSSVHNSTKPWRRF